MKPLSKVGVVFDRIINFMAWGGGVIFVCAWLSVCIDVVMRYFLNRPQVWVAEASAYTLLLLTFLSTTYVLKREGHVKMDIILNVLKPRSKALLNGLTSILGALVCLAVAWYGAQVTWEHFQSGYYMETPFETPSYFTIWVVPVGSFFLFIQFVRRSYRYLRSYRAWQTETKGREENDKLRRISEAEWNGI